MNIVVGAGIFAVPGELANTVGVYAPLAFLICAIAIGSIAICFAEGGSRMPTSGGAYGYIDSALGPRAGYIAGTLLWFSDALSCGGVAAALADTSVSLLPAGWRTVAHVAVIVCVIGLIAWVNIAGVRHGTRLINIAASVKLIPLAIFLVAGLTAVHGSNFAQTAAPSTSGAGRALILALFTFTGMEVSLSASGEVAHPSRTIPRALGISMLSLTALYIAIQTVAQGILGPELGHSAVPLADAMGRVSPSLRLLMLVGAQVSMLGWIGSDILGSPRIIFAFARDGSLPRLLGRLHPRAHTPYVAILCYSALTLVLALTGTFAELAVLGTLATAVFYALGCIAAWRLASKGVGLAGEPLKFRWLTLATAAGIASSIAAIALASRAEILGVVAMTAIAAVLYQATARARSRERDEVSLLN